LGIATLAETYALTYYAKFWFKLGSTWYETVWYTLSTDTLYPVDFNGDSSADIKIKATVSGNSLILDVDKIHDYEFDVEIQLDRMVSSRPFTQVIHLYSRWFADGIKVTYNVDSSPIQIGSTRPPRNRVRR
jgi:hypothetical protein